MSPGNMYKIVATLSGDQIFDLNQTNTRPLLMWNPNRYRYSINVKILNINNN